ncbi:hypothetical protein [Hymenobacter cheonanensis]|uniref:hypothetical protein n=1 Tax=Hymenobacter sp. CA2-7 TaxID=3063993 RepID=UPI0027136443|nr:hypothetical protein [Hymenobacter sp. CA2-7]MDO7884290.1 hypothetical protein [Hymenobacter sp. CA2-7]
MKHLLFALFFFTTLTPLLAQTPEAEPPKGSNAVLVTTTDSVGLAWRRIREALLGQGYGLAQSDAEMHSFVTTPKALSAGKTLTVTGFVSKGEAGGVVVSLSGSYILVVPTTRGHNEMTRQVAWKSGAFGSDKAMFRQLEQIAKAYPGQSKTLTYTIR